jgi:thiosulfate dehydrogenase
MKNFLFGFIFCLVLLCLGVFLYFRLGIAPVATSAASMPFERTLAGMALNARISKEMPPQAPIQADEANMVAGARIYREQCSDCHGLSGQPETAIAKGMFPHPPQLFTGHGVTDDPPGETYWKAANGIRLTGMPGFVGSLTDTQIWQVSLMLANSDKMSPAAKAIITGRQ